MNFKKFVLLAIGEILFVVIGILLALYIDNWNNERIYQKQIDNNLIRVFYELENNLMECRNAIIGLRVKDSLIYQVLSDSVQEIDYQNNLNLAYLILSYHNTNVENKAFQNLIELNTSENQYQEELVNKLKDLYALLPVLEANNTTMHKYVYDQTIPLLMENTSTFSDLSYHQSLQPNMIKFFLSSNLYKAHVSKYSILSIRNQLRQNQLFYKLALDLYHEISQLFELSKEFYLINTRKQKEYSGSYYSSLSQQNFEVELGTDTLFLIIEDNYKLRLIPINENQYFIDHNTGGFFVSFFKRGKQENYQMTINLLANRDSFEKHHITKRFPQNKR